MNVRITHFTNPFSFFCKLEDDSCKELEPLQDNDNVFFTKKEMSDLNHGQYVLVLFKNKWTRGVVTMENQFLIWLVDYGFYLRPNDRTVYVDLPAEYKKYPTKVFEASIHGVTPVDKVLTEDCQIKNEVTTLWNEGAVEKSKVLIAQATQIFFVPVALLSTKQNDVVIGDLYIRTKEHGLVNIMDELEMWPVFLQQNKKAYIENLTLHYTSRRKHRACLLKPEFPDIDLQSMSTETALSEYNNICANAPQFEPEEYASDSGDGSTIIAKSQNKDKSMFKLTPSEIEHYSCMYITVCGREYNVLNVLLNKIRDLKMCEKYKNHDLKSVGRANFHTKDSDI